MKSKKNQKLRYFSHSTSVIDHPCSIGSQTKIWHFCHISTGAIIGSSCVLGQNVFIGGQVHIGNNVKIQNNVSVYDGVTLEDYVFCGPSMVFTNDLNPRSKYPKHGKFKKTLVKEGATIGANATIVCGLTIGRHSFIGSGSVVTHNVPDFALMYGVPACQHGWVCKCGEKISVTETSGRCAHCHRQYKIQNNKCTEKAKP